VVLLWAIARRDEQAIRRGMRRLLRKFLQVAGEITELVQSTLCLHSGRHPRELPQAGRVAQKNPKEDELPSSLRKL
jgi:hypothetical protein